MELAHKLAREMDEHRTVSVSRVYAPNEYSVWLSPQDRSRYEGVEQEVLDELGAYLLEHARREELILASNPVIVFHTDERLALGEFGIQARSVRPGGHAGGEDGHEPVDPVPVQGHGQTMIYSTSRRVNGPLEEAHARRGTARALLVVGTRRLLLTDAGATIGRSRDCDIVLDDVGVSRRHAEVRPAADGWTIADLGSTNGVLVNGRGISGAHQLEPGDRVVLGSTEMTFELR